MLDDPVPAMPGAFQEPLPAALPLGLLPLEGVRTLLRYRTYFRAEAVNSDRLLKMALSLRYQVYCLERNFEEAAHFPDRLETDRYDAQSVHGVLFYRPWDKAIGTTRLILSKEGPTTNNAAAQADLRDVAGMTVTKLGYDIRKPGGAVDPRGSHCGNGAPRFNVTYSDNTTVFIGCNSPAADSTTVGDGWTRLTWNLSDSRTIKSIQIVYDEGTDTGPDNFGMAVLDNIRVNDVLVGHGDHGDAA